MPICSLNVGGWLSFPEDFQCFLRYHPDSSVIREEVEATIPLLTAKRFVISSGNKLQLAAMCHAWFIKGGLVGGFTTEKETVECCESEKPDFLLIVDDLEVGYALSAIRTVKDVSPTTKCILFTERETLAVVRDALNSATDGVVFFSSIGLGMGGDFGPSIRAVSEGTIYYPPDVRKKAGFDLKPLPSDLSVRELDVLKELCNGKTNKEIAESLVISVETVKTYVSSTIAKMGCESRLEAAVQGIRSGL